MLLWCPASGGVCALRCPVVPHVAPSSWSYPSGLSDIISYLRLSSFISSFLFTVILLPACSPPSSLTFSILVSLDSASLFVTDHRGAPRDMRGTLDLWCFVIYSVCCLGRWWSGASCSCFVAHRRCSAKRKPVQLRNTKELGPERDEGGGGARAQTCLGQTHTSRYLGAYICCVLSFRLRFA